MPSHPSRPLVELLEVEGKTPQARMQKAARVLERRIDAGTDKTTGIVTLEVEMHSPALAAAVANRLVGLLNEFNLGRRQSQSRQMRLFTERRLAQAERELRQAEQAQMRFLQSNRSYQESPALVFQAARLEREVQLKQDVYATLAKSYEEARIAEVRDTPVLTVIDSAVAPVRPTRPRRVLGIAAALVVGTVLGVALAYAAAARARVREAPTDDYLEFRAAWDEARRPTRRP